MCYTKNIKNSLNGKSDLCQACLSFKEIWGWIQCLGDMQFCATAEPSLCPEQSLCLEGRQSRPLGGNLFYDENTL